MIKKLLYFSALLPLSAFAQSAASNEVAAKASASQQIQASVASTSLLQPQDCDAVTTPYTENFESATVPALPNCTSAINVGNGNTWTTATNPGYGFTSKVLRYAWDTSSAANTWFFTKGLALTAGQTYAISYKYGSAGSAVYTEKLKVHIGTGAAVADMGTTPLIDHPLVNNNVAPITDNLTFTPQTTGTYYVGFHCYSNADQFYLFVDDISVTASLSVEKHEAKAVVAYPNPAKDVVHIDNADAKIQSVAVYNMLGQKVGSKKAGGSTIAIDVSNLPRGYYVLETSGETTSRIKIAKD